MISYSTEPGSAVVEVTVEGSVSNQDLESAITRMKADFEGGGKTRVLEVIRHFTGIEPAALWTDVRMGVPLAQKIERVAVVADQSWVRQMAEFGKWFTKAELKTFAPEALAEARSWIAQ